MDTWTQRQDMVLKTLSSTLSKVNSKLAITDQMTECPTVELTLPSTFSLSSTSK